MGGGPTGSADADRYERWQTTTLRSIAEGVITVDREARVTFMNPAAESLTGWRDEEANGVPFERVCRLLAAASGEPIASPAAQAIGRGSAIQLVEDVVLRRRDGSRVPIDDCASPIRDESGAVTGAVIVFRDRTERNRAEAERLALLERLLASQPLESLGMLASGIAHEFNNLLTAILGNAVLCREAIGTVPKAEECLDEIEAASRLAADLCKQMLAYAGRGMYVASAIDLNGTIREALALLKTSISKSIVLKLELQSDLPALACDPSQVQQLVMNLAQNAAEAVGNRFGEVRVRTAKANPSARELREAALLPAHLAPSFLRFEITDTGDGMSRETQSRIFEPFFSTKSPGRGMGLPAVYGIVRRMDGVLSVQSEPRLGTTFRVYLPIERREADRPAGTPSLAVPVFDAPRSAAPARVMRPRPAPLRQLAQAPAGPRGWRGSGLVMVVDDEALVRKVCARQMEALGFDVVTAASGGEALGMVGSVAELLRLVLLDLTMPGLNGAETLRELRKILPDLPVIVMSGYSISRTRVLFGEFDRARIVAKPFRQEALWDEVREMLN